MIMKPIVTLKNKIDSALDSINKATQSIRDLTVDTSVFKERTSICHKCESYNQLFDKCSECGCFVESKAKSENEFCPKNKW